jgi:hypothetical protein
MIECANCRHPGSHAVAMLGEGWPQRCDQCARCQGEVREERRTGEIWKLLYRLLPDHGLTAVGFPMLPGSLAEYNPVSRQVYYLDSLNDKEKVMAVLHELGHAYLHPPGSGDLPGEHLDRVEEQIVHNAALLACEHVDIRGYTEMMRSRHVRVNALTALDAASQTVVYEIASYLKNVLNHPGNPPLLPVAQRGA